MRVRIVKHRCVPYKGKDYTPADGVFDLPDDVARVLINNGTCAAPDLVDAMEAEGDGDEQHALFSLPSMTDTLLDVLVEAGYETVESVLGAGFEDLVALKHIGEKTAEKLQDEAVEVLEVKE